MVNILVLLPLVASAAAMGYPRDKPAVVPEDLDMKTKVTSQTSEGVPPTSAPPVFSLPSPLPAAVPALYPNLAPGLNPGLLPSLYSGLYAGGYPGLSTDYVSRYYGPTYVPTVLPDGHIADTPAVAAARAAHLATLERAKALWYGPRDDGSYDPYRYGSYPYNQLFENPLAAFLKTTNPNLIPSYLENIGSQLYYGPMDAHLGIPKGYVGEAKAVEMAQEAQVKALEKARTEAYLNANLFPYARFNPAYYQNVFNASSTPLATLLGAYAGLQGPLNNPYFGPLATPSLLPTGYLADTPQVAAARAVHLNALLKAKSLWNNSGPSGHGGNQGHTSGGSV